MNQETENTNQTEPKKSGLHFLFENMALFESATYVLPEIVLASDLKPDAVYLDFLLSQTIKAILREMKLHLTQILSIVTKLSEQLFTRISLLFGLCNSQSTLIFAAYSGASLGRTPSFVN